MDFLIQHKGVNKLAEYLKISRRTVGDALLGKSHSSKAKMIRRVAIEHGADVYVKVPADVYTKNREPDFETDFNHVKKEWKMTFSDRVQIIADRFNGDTSLYVDDRIYTTLENPTLQELAELQVQAQEIADKIKL